eukprot:GHRR01021361.1.p2 GENE.GHRR01021361.1~~GHRR01021361.1.p2  ORF type:complete len:114 (+),score=21.95 GHRR01021361.1:628-969(+)
MAALCNFHKHGLQGTLHQAQPAQQAALRLTCSRYRQHRFKKGVLLLPRQLPMLLPKAMPDPSSSRYPKGIDDVGVNLLKVASCIQQTEACRKCSPESWHIAVFRQLSSRHAPS